MYVTLLKNKSKTIILKRYHKTKLNPNPNPKSKTIILKRYHKTKLYIKVRVNINFKHTFMCTALFIKLLLTIIIF